MLVLATHPDRFSGWALWASSPVFAYFLYLLVFRGPPANMRLYASSAAVTGYVVVYALTAGLGDESYGVVAQAVYLFLPALGLIALLACVPVVELVGAITAARSEPTSGPRLDAFPLRPALFLGAALAGTWATVAIAGWADARTVVIHHGGPAAAVARVQCAGEDTYLSTPTVVRQADGVHVEVENHLETAVWLEYDIDGGTGGGGAEIAAPGVSSHVIFFPAGSIGVACTERGDGTASRHATMKVVAPPA